MRTPTASLAVLMLALGLQNAAAQTVGAADPSARARSVESKMTDEERFTIIHGVMALPFGDNAKPVSELGGLGGAGYVPGVARLGIPALHETDASLGVTNPMGVRAGDTATALPAGLALGSSFNPDLARRSAAMVASEARAKGFNVLLGGGMNLTRDPRNGRNFEYLSEDPLLAGTLAGQQVIGVQSQNVISTVKHYAANSYETNRHTVDEIIDEGALRESDLLAFELAIEHGKPGSIMCAYNKINGAYACGNSYLQNDVLKGAWNYKGWVMSDWGAVYGADFAVKGLDQESGEQIDEQVWFDKPLKADLAAGRLPRARLSDMVQRILTSMYTVGVDKITPTTIDAAKNAEVALQGAREGLVLLKNDHALPIAATAKTIAIIGGHADVGVLSGGGSSQVTPVGGYAVNIPLGGEGSMANWRVMRYGASSPKAELAKLLPKATLNYDSGIYPSVAAALAKRSELAIVFVTKHELEGFDSPDISLPGDQDALVDAVVAANPNTIVVLETGNPIAMPWKDRVKAILAAWYPGQAGGQAIAEILTGKVNPSGRLPISFPASVADLPRPALPGFGTPENTPVTVNMNEGADVGYRWFAKTGKKPVYAFGHGLSYTSFAYSGLSVKGGDTITASFTVKNTGARDGADVPQLYLTDMGGAQTIRLVGFQKVTLKPGQSQKVTLTADPRLLASFDKAAKQWRIKGGRYQVALSKAADAPALTAGADLKPRLFGK